MDRRRLLMMSSVLLVVAVIGAGVTGQIAVAFDINRFALHRYIAYTLLALALLHVVLVAPTLIGLLRHWSMPRRRAHKAPPAPASAPLGRRSALRIGLGLAASAGAGAAIGFWRRGLDVPAELNEAGDLGVLYHRWSRPTYAGGLLKSLGAIAQPPLYKEIPGRMAHTLPPPTDLARMPLHQAIRQRRSRRDFADRELPMQQLSDLLFLAAGETDHADQGWPFRAFPSSGALYPTETYVAVRSVGGLEPGVYHYQPARHALALVRAGDLSRVLMRAAVEQEMVAAAAATFVLASLFDRARFKYQDRSYRYALIEAGHLGQNLYLCAEALGLGCCGIGAFFDDDVNALIGVDGLQEASVYLLAVGPRHAST
ncbi:MAG: SagB/ThcOx family dehydrogenase [Chloroflexi bacterium]|nr:SagB/ThcOx family dehydrogenase [Chloroflexota bacterium]